MLSSDSCVCVVCNCLLTCFMHGDAYAGIMLLYKCTEDLPAGWYRVLAWRSVHSQSSTHDMSAEQ